MFHVLSHEHDDSCRAGRSLFVIPASFSKIVYVVGCIVSLVPRPPLFFDYVKESHYTFVRLNKAGRLMYRQLCNYI